MGIESIFAVTEGDGGFSFGFSISWIAIIVLTAAVILSSVIRSRKNKKNPAESRLDNRSGPSGSTLLTPENLINKRFEPTKFREGYSQYEVDNFLDVVVLEFRRLQKESKGLRRRVANPELVIDATPPVIITSEEVTKQNFKATKRAGYSQDEVDDFLDEIVYTLKSMNEENQKLADQIVANSEKSS